MLMTLHFSIQSNKEQWATIDYFTLTASFATAPRTVIGSTFQFWHSMIIVYN